MHPAHTAFSFGALKSEPQANDQHLHTDYPASDLPDHLMPYSCIVTFKDSCKFKYINQSRKCVSVTVPPFSFVRFMSNVVHSGGRNNTDNSQIPSNTFYLLK